MSVETETRSPATVGYLPWLLHRLSALALVVLLAVHVGVQLYPEYGFSAVLGSGLYYPLLDLTLGLVLLHAFLGVRAAVIETGLSGRTTRLLVWGVGIVLLALLVVRLLA